jgi:hypothetical protein
MDRVLLRAGKNFPPSIYDAIEPYLAAPTEDNIIDSMSTVAL